MSISVNERFGALTEKEKQTLRLIVRGHDAKSVARNLGLSVHTINERLRDARRKMAVSSSREAARLLFESEGGGLGSATPDLLGDTGIGEAGSPIGVDQGRAPVSGVGRVIGHPWIVIGVLLMTVVLALLAFAALPQVASAPPAAPPTPTAAADVKPNPDVLEAARQWLALVDQGKWDDSYRMMGSAFQKLNTAQVWADASDKMRAQLGAVISRTFLSEQNLPAPPYGYEVVKFRAKYANNANAVETVTLEREGDAWRVVGAIIE
jgi:DNA-binding CsgD family transcriptional regulator